MPGNQPQTELQKLETYQEVKGQMAACRTSNGRLCFAASGQLEGAVVDPTVEAKILTGFELTSLSLCAHFFFFFFAKGHLHFCSRATKEIRT